MTASHKPLPNGRLKPYVVAMDKQHDTTQLPPAAWIEALERGRADAAAGRTVPAESFLAELEAALTARLAKKAMDAA